MYSNIIKGFTTGHTLTRRVLRNLTSIPGVLLDFIIAIFWIPNYSSYWDRTIPYADGTRVGPLRGIFGWVGEILGFIIGPPLGITIGLALFFPDGILRIVSWLQRNIYSSFSGLALVIGNSDLFENYPVFKAPNNYFKKAWNIGCAFLGGLLAIVPSLLAKTIQFFIPPLRNGLSFTITMGLGAIGGAIIGFIAAPVWPVQFLFRKLVDLYEGFSGLVRNAIALVYAKADQEPAKRGDHPLITLPNETMHSPEFRQKVTEYQKSSWTAIIFGELNKDGKTKPTGNHADSKKLTPVSVTAEELEEDLEKAGLVDTITYDPLGEEIILDHNEPKNPAKHQYKTVPILVDKEGYSWNDYGPTKGIRELLNDGQAHDHPLTRNPMKLEDLKENRALEDALKLMRTKRAKS